MRLKSYIIIGLLLFAKLSFGQILINEFLASNVSAAVDTSDYLINSDWIELYNAGDNPVNLGGYFLSDDFDNPFKWQIPADLIMQAGAYQLFWADGKDKRPGETDQIFFSDSTSITISDYHLNFKLSADGEEIALYNADGNTVDSIQFGMQASDVSYGRKPDEPNNWAYFDLASAGTENSTANTEVYYVAEPPQFSINGEFYNGPIIVNLSHPSPLAKIYYTTDASMPTRESLKYSSPINITYTKAIKARAFVQGTLPGKTLTQTYFIDVNNTLPTVSVTTANGNLWSYDFGLFQKSLKNREIEISMEYFSESGTKSFTVDAGMQLFGSTIYQLKQKPMSVYLKNKYGSDAIEYPVFDDKAIYNYKNIVLRNGGNDNGLTLFRDGLFATLVGGKMDIDYQAFKPASVYVNGEYWGIYNLREKLNKNYLAANHHVCTDMLVILEDNAVLNDGTEEDYLALTNFLQNNDIAIQENYDYVKTQIDINEYINYKIIKTYIGYWLADLNNKYWKEKSEDGKWRWLLFDLEHAFGRNGSDACTVNTLEKISTEFEGLPTWSTLVFRKLCDNEEFRNEFIQRSASYLNTIFESEHVISVIDSIQTLFAPEMPKHISRWNSDPMAIQSMSTWNANIEEMRLYAVCRPAEMRKHIMSRFNIADTFSINITIPSSEIGHIFINDVLITDSIFSGIYFANIPIQIKAVPNFGYEFIEWTDLTQNHFLSLKLNKDTTLFPLFSYDSLQHILPKYISSNTVLTEEQSPFIVTRDLIIDSNITLTMEPGVELLMRDGSNIIVYGGLAVNGTEDNKVVIKSNPDDNARLPVFNKTPRWGAICFHNATDTSRLTNLTLSKASYGFIPTLHKAAISSFQSNIIVDNVEMSDVYQPIYVEYGSAIIKNSSLSTRLTGDIINIKYASSAVVENCILKGNNAEDTDAIDFDEISNGRISGNRIYSLFGSNSDGIDLGENCTNIVIEGNEIYNCTDKAISIGQASTAIVKHNLIVNCAQGVGIKDSSSYAFIDKNTFYNNNFSVACFEKNLGKGGASAVVQNSIFANARLKPFWADNKSDIDISYSLSTSNELTGDGNITGDPHFINAGINNFELQDISPCINTGNPASTIDPDGTRADMGAYYVYSTFSTHQLIINEINYNSGPAQYAGDWIELYNPTNEVIDLSGWLFMDANFENKYYLPTGCTIAANDYLCICNDTLAFKQQFQNVHKFVGEFQFGIDANEQLRIFDAQSNLVNSLSYTGSAPWPLQANGKGSSLELWSPGIDNSIAQNWHESYIPKGTPGEENSLPSSTSSLFINEFMASNSMVHADNKNEFDDWIELYNGSSQNINIAGLYISDNLDIPDKWQIPNTAPDSTTIAPGEYLVLWADDSTNQGVLHLNFKLDVEGEQMGLFRIADGDTIVIDSISFSQQNTNIPFGRFPDGNENFQILYPTPDSNNVLPTNLSPELIKIYPNPTSNFIDIEIIDALKETVEISIFNTLGQNLYRQQKSFNLAAPVHRIHLIDLHSGVYIIEIKNQLMKKVGKIIIQR